MTRLHFHSVQGKGLDMIDAILHTEEIASLGDEWLDIRLVVEELVVNIEDFAYPDATNDYLNVEIMRDEKSITLRFSDGGVPFNPLEKEAPDTSEPIELRKIGGMGIYMVINKMDSVDYEYTNGENILTVKKYIRK
jgi:anti-sigma regulatory factor (Ser/Thr protein kinase)